MGWIYCYECEKEISINKLCKHKIEIFRNTI